MKSIQTFKLEHLNPRHRAEAIAQGCTPTAVDALPAPIADAPAPKRMRQSAKPLMNELETRFFEKITRDYAGSQILVQGVRLELARGHWYKPDFFIPHGSRGANGFVPLAYE